MPKDKKINESSVLGMVFPVVQECTNWYNSKLTKERERVINYREGKLPKRQSLGNSSYVSSDVHDGLETAKAQLLETFCGNSELAVFDPTSETDIVQSRVETRYVNYVIHELNPGFTIFSEVIDDGLSSRIGVAKAQWEEKYDYNEETFEDLPLIDAEALASREDVVEFEAEAPDDDDQYGQEPVYSGKLKRRIDKCGVRISVLPPENFFVEPRLAKREDGIRGNKELKTKSELMKDLGYPKSKVNKVRFDVTQYSDDAEKLARFQDTDTGTGYARSGLQTATEKTWLYETYAPLDLKGDGEACLYRVVHTDTVLFEVDEVDEDPYVTYVPLPRPHNMYGENYAAGLIPTQNSRTALTRAILDHTALTVAPKWQVLNGALMNPKELLESRMGGIVNVKRQDGIAPLQYSNLNPFVFETLQMLQANKEERTGISSLSQGLNKDAISKQNSQGMVQDLVSLSQVRQKIMARNFAEQFLVPLYLKVHRLAIANEKTERLLEISGEFAQVDPRQFRARRTVRLSLHLGYGEAEREGQKYLQAHTMLAQNPAMAGNFTPDQHYALATKILKKFGMYDFPEFLLPPDKKQSPPPDPIKMKELENAGILAQAALITAQAAMMKAQASQHHEAVRTENDTAKASATIAKMSRDADRQDLDTTNRVDVSQREITMLENAPPESENAIISPSS